MEDYEAITNPYLQTVPLDPMSYHTITWPSTGTVSATGVWRSMTGVVKSMRAVSKLGRWDKVKQ